MNWQDKGYLISSNRYNENSSIIELFTQERGKVKGILFGATSKKIKNYLFVGNCFHINFSSKNENSIGNFKLEIDKVNTPIFLEDQIKLSCIVNIFNLIKLLTVENQKNGKIFELISIFFKLLIKENWLTSYIFWELDLYKNLGYELNFSNYEDIYNKMINSVESFSGLKNHNLELESYIIPSEFKPMFVYKDDSNEFDSDLIRVYEGRVLIKDNDSFEIQKEGDANYIKDETQFNISKDILSKYNLTIGDQIKLIYKTDNIEVSGKVKSEIDLVNTISITGLFGEMATEMQNSENKDWSMDLPILDYKTVTIKK